MATADRAAARIANTGPLGADETASPSAIGWPTSGAWRRGRGSKRQLSTRRDGPCPRRIAALAYPEADGLLSRRKEAPRPWI